jgi:hypothetical protein
LVHVVQPDFTKNSITSASLPNALAASERYVFFETRNADNVIVVDQMSIVATQVVSESTDLHNLNDFKGVASRNAAR